MGNLELEDTAPVLLQWFDAALEFLGLRMCLPLKKWENGKPQHRDIRAMLDILFL